MTTTPFPLALDVLAPPEVLAALSPLELGALLLLTRAAWGMDPPCCVPDGDEQAILRWSGLRPGESPGYLSVVRRVFTPDGQGRLVNESALTCWRRSFEQAARRSAAGRAAIKSRWARERGERGGGPEPPGGQPKLRVVRPPGTEDDTNRIRNVYESNTNRIGGCPPHTPPLKTSESEGLCARAPALNPSERRSERARNCAPADVSAGARARPEEDLPETVSRRLHDLRVNRELAECRRMLQRAEFAWAASEDRRRLFPSRVEALLASPNALRLLETPDELLLLTDYALSEVARTRPASPMGMLISAFGAHRGQKRKAWEVPMWHREAFVRRRAAIAGALDAQARIDALREAASRGSASGASAPAVGGAP